MIDRLRKAIYLLLALALLLQACEPSGVKQNQARPVTLRVSLLPYISYAPFAIGKEEGYFADQGLEIELVEMRSENIIPTLVQGKVDVGAGFMGVSILNAIERGARIKFVADKGHIAPSGGASTALVARRTLVESGELDSPAQLKDKRIVMQQETIEGYYVEKLLNSVNLTLDDIEMVDIPSPPVELEALKNGTIDLTATSEPWVTRMLQAGHGILWMPIQKIIPNFQFAFILYGPTLLDKDPGAGRRFMVAYLKSVQQYNQGKTERNLDILSKFTGLDRELLKEASWAQMRNDGKINVESVLDFQTWAVGKGFLDNKVTEEQIWEPGFVEHACQVLNIPAR